jgi:hypothetical protein
MTNIAEVRVLNSEINTHYYMNLYVPEVKEFFQFVLANRKIVPPPNGMPGVSGPATLALERLFANVPSKFPLVDLIRFLQKERGHFCSISNPAVETLDITCEEIEDALIRWYIQGEKRSDAVTIAENLA